jgi:PAS domain S-box-containing protein
MERMSGADEYRQLLDAAPDAMIVVSAEGTITFANAQTGHLFGYENDELIGRRLDVLIPEKYRAAHGGHLARFFGSPTRRPMGSGLELFGRRKDGLEVPIEVSISPIHLPTGTAGCASIRDISERKRMEQVARISAERLVGAVETMQDAFALFGADDRLALCNAPYRTLLGVASSAELVGASYEDLLDRWMASLAFASDQDRLQFRAERLAGRRDPKGAFDVRTKEGRSLRVLDRRTEEGGIVKTIWDLTDDVLLTEELKSARAAADAASAAKSEFLSSMSHELRTPLNAILGFAQLLGRDKREPLSERHKERVAQILRGGEHLLRLIDDILDLSHIEAGRVSISTEAVDVVEILDELRTTLEPTAARADVRVTVSPTPVDARRVRADRTRFAQIVTNFGTNAIKYNRPGGTVTVSARLNDERTLRVAVIDTGMGIPVDKQDKLFQPFQRAGQETGAIEGTGIGLVIAKRLAELMGGRVGFRSDPGSGSEFWVDLPAEASSVAPAPTAAAAADSASQFEGPGGRLVLYVEDNPANVAFMRDLLRDFDRLELLTAPTAEMGLELASGRRPHAVIMDINLPGMNGFEALTKLRGQPATADIPVIALTASASDRERQRGLKAGFFRYLTKPVKVDEFIEALAEILSKS